LESSAFSGFGSVNLAAISSSGSRALIVVVSDAFADAGSSHSIAVVRFATNCRAIRGSSECTGNAHLIVNEAAQASSISRSALSDRQRFASGSLCGSGRSRSCSSSSGGSSGDALVTGGVPGATSENRAAGSIFVSTASASASLSSRRSGRIHQPDTRFGVAIVGTTDSTSLSSIEEATHLLSCGGCASSLGVASIARRNGALLGSGVEGATRESSGADIVSTSSVTSFKRSGDALSLVDP
jgi:hypothetical protein